MKLVPEWRALWRSYSVMFQAAAVVFFSSLGALTDVAIQVWDHFPADIKSVFPPWLVYGFGVFLIVGGILSRFYAQRKLTEARQSELSKSGGDDANKAL